MPGKGREAHSAVDLGVLTSQCKTKVVQALFKVASFKNRTSANFNEQNVADDGRKSNVREVARSGGEEVSTYIRLVRGLHVLSNS